MKRMRKEIEGDQNSWLTFLLLETRPQLILEKKGLMQYFRPKKTK